MIYKTYKCNSFNVHTIKTDKFKTAHMEIMFRKYANKDELGELAFLVDMLCESTKKYPKKRNLITKFEELYKMSVYGTTIKTGKVINTNFIVDFINPEYISDDIYLEEVIKLPFEIIGNPNEVNEEFDLKQFNLIKERLKKEINSLKENPVKLSIKKAFDLMDADTPSNYALLGTIDDLEKITPSSLYMIYKRLLKENVCDIFIIGNLDMDEVVKLIKKYFKNRYINNTELVLDVDNKVRKKEIVGSEESENVQSNLVMIFNVENLTRKEKDVTFQAFNYLFGNGGLTSKLYKNIREENSLCYGINSMYLKYDSLLIVHVSLENENVKKAVMLTKKCLKDMCNGNFTIDELEDAKNNLIMSLDLAQDNNVAILNNFVFNEFDKLPEIDKRKELFKSLVKEEIMNAARKVKLNTIFTLKGKGD